MLTLPPHNLINHIINKLVVAEYRRLAKTLDTLMSQNNEAYGEQFDGFHYQGQFYRPEGLKGNLKRRVLHDSLHARMDAYLSDIEKVGNDMRQIRQGLFLVLDPCVSLQDLRDAVPDCILDTLPPDYESAKRLSRTREAAYTIKDNSRAYRQFQKTLPLMQFYSAARLFY